MSRETTDSTQADDGDDSLWMVCRRGGDQIVRWRDLTEAEQLNAIRHHNNKIYGIGT